MNEGGVLVWCPFPDPDSARAAATALLDERLIACANMIPGVESLFGWQGTRGQSAECGVLLKTTAARREQAVERLALLHPYDAPAIMAWSAHADNATQAWLEAETTPKT